MRWKLKGRMLAGAAAAVLFIVFSLTLLAANPLLNILTGLATRPPVQVDQTFKYNYGPEELALFWGHFNSSLEGAGQPEASRQPNPQAKTGNDAANGAGVSKPTGSGHPSAPGIAEPPAPDGTAQAANQSVAPATKSGSLPADPEDTPAQHPGPVPDTGGQEQSQNQLPVLLQGPAGSKLNKETDNLNVLFVGVGDGTLLMVSLYSIDHQESWRSAAIFFPVQSMAGSVGSREQLVPLSRVFAREEAAGVVKVLEEKLDIKIDYYIRVDRQILKKVGELIDPIYVEDKQVDIHNLFDMEVTPHDDYILGELVKQFRKPSVFFFSLPELFFATRKYISTDFAITPGNLYLHYRVARGIDPALLTKTIVSGHDVYYQGERLCLIPEDTWKNIVYRLTRN